jgi:hypothetical protein
MNLCLLTRLKERLRKDKKLYLLLIGDLGHYYLFQLLIPKIIKIDKKNNSKSRKKETCYLIAMIDEKKEYYIILIIHLISIQNLIFDEILLILNQLIINHTKIYSNFLFLINYFIYNQNKKKKSNIKIIIIYSY